MYSVELEKYFSVKNVDGVLFENEYFQIVKTKEINADMYPFYDDENHYLIRKGAGKLKQNLCLDENLAHAFFFERPADKELQYSPMKEGYTRLGDETVTHEISGMDETKSYQVFMDKAEGVVEKATGRVVIPAKYTQIIDLGREFMFAYNNHIEKRELYHKEYGFITEFPFASACVDMRGNYLCVDCEKGTTTIVKIIKKVQQLPVSDYGTINVEELVDGRVPNEKNLFLISASKVTSKLLSLSLIDKVISEDGMSIILEPLASMPENRRTEYNKELLKILDSTKSEQEMINQANELAKKYDEFKNNGMH